ncbi:MAG: hypothetical protein M9894_18585 [Planctomycetes bacterium]|nr:hypothetical protein [Planctomycetota bacterium]
MYQAVHRARSSAYDLARCAEDAASRTKLTSTGGRVAMPGFESPSNDPLHVLTAGVSRFVHEARSGAALVGGPWVSVVHEFAQDIQQKCDALDRALRSPPAYDPVDYRPRNKWSAEVDSLVETIRGMTQTYVNNITMAMEMVIDEAKEELLRKEKEPKALAAQPEGVINVLLNVLHLYQFNVHVINITIEQTIEREAEGVPEADRAQFQAIALELREALASGDSNRIRTALDSARVWVTANPGDRSLAIIGVLLAILGILLALK